MPRKRPKKQPMMTRAEARAFKRRWKAVNAFEIEETRRTPLELKLRQVATLMEWVKFFGWDRDLAAGENETRERWIRLKAQLA